MCPVTKRVHAIKSVKVSSFFRGAKIALTGAGLTLLFLCPTHAFGTEAHITQIVREAKLHRSGSAPVTGAIETAVQPGTAVQTASGSRVEITFADEKVVRLGANSTFELATDHRMKIEDGAVLVRAAANSRGARVDAGSIATDLAGTTALLEHHAQAYLKLIVLEGTARVFLPGKAGESVLVRGGQMLITKTETRFLPEPVEIDLDKILQTSSLITGFAHPLGSEPLLLAAKQQQLQQKRVGELNETNLAIFGGGTNVTLLAPRENALPNRKPGFTRRNKPVSEASSKDSNPTTPQ